MKFKQILSIIIVCIVVGILYILNISRNTDLINSYYMVYLNGDVLGYIESEDELYSLINNEQDEIMKEYNVDTVYPPSSFNIIKTSTYDSNVVTANKVYKMIEEKDSFAIKGYIITFKGDEESTSINVLDRKDFEDALFNFVKAFIDEETYYDYINDLQEELDGEGSLIEKMYFDKSISIKEGLMDVNAKIYTNSSDVLEYLLFGENAQMVSYTVKLGDSLSSIAEDNYLNAQELLIINPSYKTEDAILQVGDKLNVTVINPVINFICDVKEVKQVETVFDKKTVYDSSKSVGYSEVTTPGVTGISIVTTEYQTVNGEANSEAKILNTEVIREMVTQVTTKGSKSNSIGGTGSYIDTGLDWGWPTNSGYVITSGFKYRWGKHHDGIDISGTGEGSPIYAASSGVVYYAGYGGSLGSNAGYNVVIEHADNYWTAYAHMRDVRVKSGQTVVKGQVIGTMGHTGYATGTHLHFAASIGRPYSSEGYKFFNPLELYK